jgi:ATP-dependent Clp protease ATP-binding subunit ClpC
VIIMTSNIGARELQKDSTVGFGRGQTEVSERVLQEARNMLAPEFINRLDEVVMFNELQREDLGRICDLLLRDLQTRLQQNNVRMSYTPRVRQHIVDHNMERGFGARPLKRLISRMIENQIADLLLQHACDRVTVTVKRGQIQVNPDTASGTN